MTNDSSHYFEEIKNLCISECKSHSFEEIAKGMFSKKEIIDTFLQQETKDPTFGFVIKILDSIGVKNQKIYIPGAGTGGMGRQIAKHFPKTKITQMDKNSNMIKINQNHSKGNKNIKIIQGDISKRTFDNETFDIIIAQGIIRYVTKDKRNELLEQRRKLIKKNGKIIVCEGIAKNIIDELKHDKLKSTGTISQKAKLFRFSLFYLLYKKYKNNKLFYEAVEKEKKENNKNYVQILREIAGKNNNKIYAKIYTSI